MGLKNAHRHVSEDIDWSTSRVLAQTIERAKQIKLPVTLLPARFDVDNEASLRQHPAGLLRKDRKQRVAYQAAYTRAYLLHILKSKRGERIWRNIAEFDRAASGGSRRCDLTME